MPTKVPNPKRKLAEAPPYMSLVNTSTDTSDASLPIPSFHDQWLQYQTIEATYQKQILIVVTFLVTLVLVAMVVFGI